MSEPFLFSQFRGENRYEWLAGWLVLLLFGLPLIVFCYKVIRTRMREHRDEWLLMFAFAPVIGAFVLSWLLPYPVWGSRHLIICAVPYFIAVALAIFRLQPYWLRITLSLVLACWFFSTAAMAVAIPAPQFTWCSWEELVPQMPAEVTSSTPTEIYAFEDLVAYHLWFAGSQNGRRLHVTVIKNIPELNEDPAFFLPRRFDEIKVGDQSNITGEHIWLAFRSRRWDESAPPMSIVRSMGYQTEQVLSMKAQGEYSFLVELRYAR